MSTLLQFLQKERNLNWKFWFSYYWNQFLNAIYQRKMSNNTDNSWKNIKISHTITPEGWDKENTFEFLEKEYSGLIMKRFKD